MRQGLLIVHLGTPSRLSFFSIALFLGRFLSDKQVIQLPFLLRYLLVYAFIIPFRLYCVKENYRKIWRKTGSPLLLENQKLQKALQKALGKKCKVALAMRYSRPSMQEALDSLKTCESITVLPLFPHYSTSTTGTISAELFRLLQKWPQVPQLRLITRFYNHPAFIQAQASSIKPFLKNHDFVLLSYHGLPINHAQSADYQAQCEATTQALSKALRLKHYAMSFQSRLGRAQWLKPYTEEYLTQLIQNGIKRLLVVTPGFTCDCLETLEEIGMRAKERWLDLGGESLTLVPALNAQTDWVQAVIAICQLN